MNECLVIKWNVVWSWIASHAVTVLLQIKSQQGLIVYKVTSSTSFVMIQSMLASKVNSVPLKWGGWQKCSRLKTSLSWSLEIPLYSTIFKGSFFIWNEMSINYKLLELWVGMTMRHCISEVEISFKTLQIELPTKSSLCFFFIMGSQAGCQCHSMHFLHNSALIISSYNLPL